VLSFATIIKFATAVLTEEIRTSSDLATFTRR